MKCPVYLTKNSKRVAGYFDTKTNTIEYKPESKIIVDIINKAK